MSPRTLFLRRLIGLYCIVVGLSMMTRRQAMLGTVNGLLQNPSMMLILGVIALGAGLAMVLAHNIWSGGTLAVVVTIIGWLTLIKGLLFLFLSPETEAGSLPWAASFPAALLFLCRYLAAVGYLPHVHWIQVEVTVAGFQQSRLMVAQI